MSKSLIVVVVAPSFDTVPMNASIFTMLFSMMRFPRPSLEIDVTKGPAVVQLDARRARLMIESLVLMSDLRCG